MFFAILAAVLLAAVSYWYTQRKAKNKLNWLPHVPGKPLVGNAFEFGNTIVVLDNFTSYLDQFNGLCVISIGPRRIILTSDYDFLKFVLSSTKILDKSDEYGFMERWLGTGLLTAKAEKWKKTRKITTPAFHFSILEQFVPIFEANGKTMIDLLEKEVGKDSVDIFPYVRMCSLDIICETAMGVSIDAQRNSDSEYVFAVKEMGRITIERSFSPFKRFDYLYPFSLDFYKELKYVKILHDRTNEVIKARKSELGNKRIQENGKTEDQFGVKEKMVFLDLLLHATMDGEPLSDDVIRQEVDTFMFEGHDTTASGVSSSLYCLANHPEVQAKVVEEQRAIFEEDPHRTVTYRDLMEMKYLELVIKEVLRLYPSVPFYGRESKTDIEYKEGKIIPKGVSIIIYAYGIGRNPKYFPNPEKFDPTRFNDIDGSTPYAYIPFSAGPRNCIGQKFAMLELKSVLSKVLRNYELLPASPKHTLIFAAETVLRSVNGVKISLKKRIW